jgi:hypothetical protein
LADLPLILSLANVKRLPALALSPWWIILVGTGEGVSRAGDRRFEVKHVERASIVPQASGRFYCDNNGRVSIDLIKKDLR